MPTQLEGLSFQLNVALREFLDLQELVFFYVRESLASVAHRPPYFYLLDGGILSQSNMLL